VGKGLAWGLRPESARGVQLLYNVHAIDSPIDVKLLAVGKAIAIVCCNLLMHKGEFMKQLPAKTYQKYLHSLQASQDLTAGELKAISIAINSRTLPYQAAELVAAAENCNCIIAGQSMLKGFQFVRRVWTEKFEAILEPLPSLEQQLALPLQVRK